MNELLELILTPLEAGLSGQLRQRVEGDQDDLKAEDDNLYVFGEALQDFPDRDSPEWWLDPAQCRWWLCLHVDWKAYSEVAWQVQAICRTLGLETGFVSEAEAQWDSYFEELDRLRSRHADSGSVSQVSLTDRLKAALGKLGKAARQISLGELMKQVQPPSPNFLTPDVLGDASEWLRRQGYELLYLDTGGDEHLAVPVRLDLLVQARAVAERLSIPTHLV
ncbi:hypothetical protein Q0M94_11090 [Deinococcus radiomollis]|uniref:DUF6630 family protein n=1 Tax=Deinococcus radiomollis TaxID=468916 RepID=UPI00389133D6